MNINHKLLAQQIVEAMGGFQNIKDVSHCLTRIRIHYKNVEDIDEHSFKTMKGITGYRKFIDQYQIVVGSEVNDVYKEITAIKESVSQMEQEQKNLSFQSFISFVSECMTQLIPGLLGCGMFKTLLLVLTTSGILSSTSNEYIVLYSFADSFFYFLPIMVGYVIAKQLKGNPVLYMCVGAALCYPNFVSLMNGNAMELHTFYGIDYIDFFGLPLVCNTYTGTILPMFLMAYYMKWIEGKTLKYSPKLVKPFLAPMSFILLCIPMILFVMAPIGAILGKSIAEASLFFYRVVPGITLMIVSMIMPFIIATGMHYVLIPIMIQNIDLLGYDSVFLIAMYCSNLSQGGAALGVSIKTNNIDLKSQGFAASISALVAGITEVAMYGISFRYKTALISSIIVAGLGGLLSGTYLLKSYELGGSPSLLSMFTFIRHDGQMDNFLAGLAIGLIVLVFSVGLSFVLYKEENKISEEEIMPMEGEYIELNKVSSEVFASGIMGDGYGILPSSGKVVAPFDGAVESIYETKHILFLKNEENKVVMIHIGLNTSYLDGKFFNVYVKEKEPIKKGQLLMEFDCQGIEDAGFSTESVVINIEDEIF